MQFVEITPTKKSAGTGVRMSNTERAGLTIALSGDALAALGSPKVGATCKVLFGADPVSPVVRIVLADDGAARLVAPPGRSKAAAAANAAPSTLMLRLGRQPKVAAALAQGLACTWEAADGTAIHVDLPREFVARETITARVPGAAPTPRNGVSLPKVSI